MYRLLGEADNWIEKRQGRQRHFHRLPCQKGRPKILWLNSFDDCQWLLSCKDIFEWKFSRWPHGWQPDNYIKLGCSRWRTSAGWLIAFPKLNCHWAKTTSWVTNKLHGRNEIKYFVQTWRPKWHRLFITNNQSWQTRVQQKTKNNDDQLSHELRCHARRPSELILTTVVQGKFLNNLRIRQVGNKDS